LLDRRHFLSSATGLAASLAFSNNLFAQLEKAPTSLPESDLYEKMKKPTGPNCEDNFSSPLTKFI